MHYTHISTSECSWVQIQVFSDCLSDCLSICVLYVCICVLAIQSDMQRKKKSEKEKENGTVSTTMHGGPSNTMKVFRLRRNQSGFFFYFSSFLSSKQAPIVLRARFASLSLSLHIVPSTAGKMGFNWMFKANCLPFA